LFQLLYRDVSKGPVFRHYPQAIAFDANDRSIVGIRKVCRVLRYGLQHRLQVGWRVADNAQNLAGGSLPRKRLLQLVGARFGLPLPFGGPALIIWFAP